MRGHRGVWGVVAAAGALAAVAGLVWLFVVLGAERADRISSGIGAGAAVVGLIVAAQGVAMRRADTRNSVGPEPAPTSQSVVNSVIDGGNVQVGGSVHGSVTVSQDLGGQKRGR